MNKTVRVFAPATVANVGPGYDIFGFALNSIGDVIEASLTESSGIVIESIKGNSELSKDPKENILGIVASAMLKEQKSTNGIRFTLEKNVLPGSGLGSSGSSAAGTAFAVNELLGKPYNRHELVNFAMLGEAAVSGKAHADNVAASILGGFTIIKGYEPLDIFTVPFPKDLYVAVIHPQIEVKTADSKKILKKELSVEKAVTQCGNVAGFVAGLIQSDYELMSRSMHDVIAEPVRSLLIPAYNVAKTIALSEGAIGCNISGSGPSIFALTKGKDTAEKVREAFNSTYRDLNISYKSYVSSINEQGTQLLT